MRAHARAYNLKCDATLSLFCRFLVNDLSSYLLISSRLWDNILFWKISKLSWWIFLSEKPYACCQNSASPSYKIILFRAIFLNPNYPELFNEVSVLLNMQKCSNRVVESSSDAKISPHTKNQPCTFKINDFDILAFSMIYRPKMFRKNHKMSVKRW